MTVGRWRKDEEFRMVRVNARRMVVGIWLVLFGCLYGCATPEHLSSDFGQSFEAIFRAQTLNPEAPATPDPPEGMAGVAVEGIYAKYKAQFE